MNPNLIIDASYFAAAFLFIYGLKRMSSPVTARSGIQVAGLGMAVAIIASFLYFFNVSEEAKPHVVANAGLAALALLIGLGWAWRSGKKVAMTAMPQMVAIYNGLGGGAAALIAAVELLGGHANGVVELVVTVIGALIGSISFSGSVIAWAKLDGRINKTWRVKGQQLINGTVMLITVLIGAYIVGVAHGNASPLLVIAFFVGALTFGVLMTMPIGGADMPVVISLYNAFTGMAVGLEGFVLQNPAMIIAGVLVGSAGTLLTILMARAMNRSIPNILFSNFGEVDAGGGE